MTNLPTKAISFTPIAPKGSKLFHAKSYGLINSNHNIIKDYRGCAIITSANLTKAGISKNVEIGQIIFDRNSLRDFYQIFLHLKKDYSLSEEEIVDKIKYHQEFQTAIRVLSMGSFYHQWKQKHKIDLRFRLTLSAGEIEKRKKKIDESKRYIGYESENGAKSISRVPIDIQDFFNQFSKPIPEKFLGYYGVDTLLGKWVPNKISDLIENRLNYITDIYLELLKEKLNQELNRCLEQLESDLDHFKHEEIIDRTDKDNNEAISRWTDKIKNLIKDKNLLKLLIWEYEKSPMSINSVQEPKLILTIYERLKQFYNTDSNRLGVGDILSIHDRHNRLNDFISKKLVTDAEKKLKKNSIGDLYKKENKGKIFYALVKPQNQILTGYFVNFDYCQLSLFRHSMYDNSIYAFHYKKLNNENEQILTAVELITFKIID